MLDYAANTTFPSTLMYKSCSYSVCSWKNSSNPAACSSSGNQICACSSPISTAVTIFIDGSFGSYLTQSETFQTLFEKDLLNKFASYICVVNVSITTSLVTLKITIPFGITLEILYGMSTSAWLVNFVALVGSSVSGVRVNGYATTALPTSAGPQTTTSPPTKARSSSHALDLTWNVLIALLVASFGIFLTVP